MVELKAVILHYAGTASTKEAHMQSLLDKIEETLRPEGVIAEVIRVEANDLTAPQARDGFAAQPFLGKLLAADLLIISTPTGLALDKPARLT